jgi:hypothetical protein
MVDVSVVKQKLQDYIINQIDILGESNPAIKLVKPLAKRAIINNIDTSLHYEQYNKCPESFLRAIPHAARSRAV